MGEGLVLFGGRLLPGAEGGWTPLTVVPSLR